ncbi:DUF3574 domain-containing protein [Aquimonas sp.]|jgi:hypothetical protein|uniref:DUF3574 domain-containing protein n=1 Tax=Aquimonas sp. TaxID=1872588 RepID=UPI0037C13842
MSRARPVAAALSVCLVLSACAGSLQRSWVRTELYFGLGTGADENATAFERYLDDAVGIAFPAGFTWFDAQGQWQPADGGRPKRLHSRVLVILHPAQRSSDARIEALRAEWKRRSGHESVLRVDIPARVEF